MSLSHASQHQVTVGYADAGTGTATAGAAGAAGADYVTLTAGTLTFAAGDTTRTAAIRDGLAAGPVGGRGVRPDVEGWRRTRATVRPEHGVSLDLRLRW